MTQSGAKKFALGCRWQTVHSACHRHSRVGGFAHSWDDRFEGRLPARRLPHPDIVHSPTGSPDYYNCQWRDFPRQQRLAKQLELFPTDKGAAESERASTFADNLSQPVHRWFRYSAGFSAPWVEGLIQREKAKGRRRVLDPFAGSGTSLLAAECCDIDAMGIEAHPFVARIAQAREHPFFAGTSIRAKHSGCNSLDLPLRFFARMLRPYGGKIPKHFASMLILSQNEQKRKWEMGVNIRR